MVFRKPVTKKRSLLDRLFRRKQQSVKKHNNAAVVVKHMNARLPPTNNNNFVQVTHNNAKPPHVIISELKDKIGEMQADYKSLENRYMQCISKDGNSARRRLKQQGYNTSNPENLTRWVRAQTPLTATQKKLIHKGFNPKSNTGLSDFLEYQMLSSGKRKSSSKSKSKKSTSRKTMKVGNVNVPNFWNQ